MNFSNLIGNMMNTQKIAAAKDYTVAELLQEDFINNFTKFGSLDQFLQHTGLAANAIIKPGELNDKKINQYIRSNSTFRDLDHVLTVAMDYVVKMQMVEGIFSGRLG